MRNTVEKRGELHVAVVVVAKRLALYRSTATTTPVGATAENYVVVVVARKPERSSSRATRKKFADTVQPSSCDAQDTLGEGEVRVRVRVRGEGEGVGEGEGER